MLLSNPDFMLLLYLFKMGSINNNSVYFLSRESLSILKFVHCRSKFNKEMHRIQRVIAMQ